MAMRLDQNGGPPDARGAEIIDFKAARRRAIHHSRALEGYMPDSPERVRARQLQNLAAALVVITLVVGGTWLIVHLRESMRIEACVEAGRRNCAPIDTSTGSRP